VLSKGPLESLAWPAKNYNSITVMQYDKLLTKFTYKEKMFLFHQSDVLDLVHQMTTGRSICILQPCSWREQSTS
jgi:hypothetical protein